MPLIRRHNQATTNQPADSGTVPVQRETPEGTTTPETSEYRQGEGLGTTETTGYRQGEDPGTAQTTDYGTAQTTEYRQGEDSATTQSTQYRQGEDSATTQTTQYRQGEGRGTTETRDPATQAEYRRTEGRPAEGRQAGAHAAGESAGARAPRRYYGMAGTMMILSGLVTFFIGIIGVIRGAFFNHVTNYPFYFSVLSRGITFLVIGSVAFLLGLALLVHVSAARTPAIITAVVSAVANFMFLPFYPFWSIAVFTLNILIIWELTRERERREFVRLRVSRGGQVHAQLWQPARQGEETRWQASGPGQQGSWPDRACGRREDWRKVRQPGQ